METDKLITARYMALESALNECQRWLYAAMEAKVPGHGGIRRVHEATGVARGSILTGLKELEQGIEPLKGEPRRIRREGAGRKKLIEQDSGVLEALERFVDPVTRGDPKSPLCWTGKSLKQLSRELSACEHTISHVTVGTLLKELGYSRQGNRTTLEGTNHPDRNKQFEFINEKIKTALATGQPVISVDTKKKELVGQYKNGGKEWCPQGQPEFVNVYDFVDDHGGWRRKQRLSGSTMVVELQRLADELSIPIRVSHFPPGTSKWNKIEHRLFSYISLNWRGKPLASLEVIINLIAATTTCKGLKVRAQLDVNSYPKGIKVSDDEFASIRLTRDNFHGEWNYTIAPNNL